MKKLRIVHDDCPFSPRSEFGDDNLGTIAYSHKNYILGEEKISDPIDWLIEKLELSEDYVYKLAERLKIEYYSYDMKKILEKRFFSKYIALPLHLYDHSEITMKTTPFTCKWDSGQIGYIYVTKEKAKKEYNYKRLSKERKDKVLSYLEGEIECFDQFLTGDTYGFIIEDEKGEEIDSCYGFFGSDPNVNGIKDHIPKELHPQLENIEIEY